MRRSFWMCVLGAVALVSSGGTVRGDLLIYRPDGFRPFILQGEATVNPGRTVSFNHSKFGNFYFSLQSAEIIEAPSILGEYNKKLNKAKASKEKDPKVKAEGVFQAGQFALKRGLTKHFLEAVNETLKIDPQHARALEVISLQALISQPIGDSSAQEKELRDFVRIKSMKVTTSDHFMLLHDTPDKPKKGRKKSRAKERLDLLEQVYHSFLYVFHSRGCELDVPKERLKVVLFEKYDTYLTFSVNISPSLASAAGYWSPANNISVFYDHGKDPQFEMLQDFGKRLNEVADALIKSKARGANEDIRLARTINLLIDAEQENMDITVVSHEATHQMAGNTGLLPRDVMIPSWVHEGLASYFEAPGDATWAGIGAVNEMRLEWYKGLASIDREHSNIDFIIGDQIFDYAGSHASILHGYAQAWALTHFLVENHPEKYVEYCKILGEMPRDVQLSPEILTKLFAKVFGAEYAALDTEWRSYMDSLRTDVQIIIDENEDDEDED